MSITGSTTITPLATASPLAALSELDNPTAAAIPAGIYQSDAKMNYYFLSPSPAVKFIWHIKPFIKALKRLRKL